MIDCISVDNMRRSDAQTIAHFVPSLELMRRAAQGVFEATTWQAPVAIVTGSGNNGGDGYALAQILKNHNIDCTVFSLSARLSPDSAYYADIARSIGVPIQEFSPNCLKGFAMVVDCLLGTGFQGSVREPYRTVIEEINHSQAFVLSVDINSGLNGDTGEAEIAVHSDLTVTIGYVKTGLITENAGTYIKRLTCVDIGIVLAEKASWICSESEWKALCKDPDTDRTAYFRCPSWLNMEILKV